MRALAIAMAVAAAAVAAAAFALPGRAGGPWDPLARTGPQRVTIHILPSTGGREVVLDPNVAIVPGVPVRLTIINASTEFHSFTIPRLHVNAVVMPGSRLQPRTTAISFTAPGVGDYQWHCDFCPTVHHAGGMGGTIYALVTG